MDYLTTYLNYKLQYYASNMKLNVESDATYLVLSNAKSRIAGHFYLSVFPVSPKTYPQTYNAPIHTECYTLKKCSFICRRSRMRRFFSQMYCCYWNLQCTRRNGPSSRTYNPHHRQLYNNKFHPLSYARKKIKILGYEI